jgi:hypothetical protein
VIYTEIVWCSLTHECDFMQKWLIHAECDFHMKCTIFFTTRDFGPYPPLFWPDWMRFGRFVAMMQMKISKIDVFTFCDITHWYSYENINLTDFHLHAETGQKK